MKWRGQGILVVLVLGAAAAYSYQWTTYRALEEQAISHGIDYNPYTRIVEEFVSEQRRWPEADEIYLPTPPADGVIKSAELQPEGKILLTLSAWTLTSGHAEVILAPTLSTHAALPGSDIRRLRYSCQEVDPAQFERIACRSIGYANAEQVAEANTDGFENWLNNEADAQQRRAGFQKAVAAAKETPTRCDELWEHAKTQVFPCLQARDPNIADRVREGSRNFLQRPKLRPEVVARNPDMLKEFNRACDADWKRLAVQVKAAQEELADCF